MEQAIISLVEWGFLDNVEDPKNLPQAQVYPMEDEDDEGSDRRSSVGDWAPQVNDIQDPNWF